MLKRTIGLVASLTILLGACGGDKKAKTPEDPNSSAVVTKEKNPTQEATKVVEATGDMRDILLALQRVHFAYDTDELTEPSREALDEAAQKLNKHDAVELHVEGHADQRGTEEYNIALAERRARAVTKYLGRLGVTESRLHPISYGEDRPIVEGEGREAMATNRRVDFRLMKGNVRFVLKEGTRVTDEGTPLNKVAE